MFHVLDHTELVYSGDLSQATRYILEHSGKRLDEAIRSGIRILYSDALHALKLGTCADPALLPGPGADRGWRHQASALTADKQETP
jgi:hypothetical protein